MNETEMQTHAIAWTNDELAMITECVRCYRSELVRLPYRDQRTQDETLEILRDIIAKAEKGS